mmetsp:Transcript_27451/g.71076  ORF Transcript_27451/g.71076 Transcript_27451/m.71076 type:complete len:329 (+) Transcript_27451:170-1156(+)
MITAQQEHKSRWRGRYWRRVELELVDGGAVVLGGSPKALVRISDEGSDVVRIEIADLAASEAARRACVLPKTETLRLRGAGLFEALDTHRRCRSTAVPPPEPPAPRPPAESGPPLPPAPGADATDATPTVGALEARLTKLQRSDLERRLAALNPATAGAAPPVEALRERLAALRDGDATGPAFVDRPKGFLDAASDDEDEDAIVARAREAARLDGRVCSDDGLLECLAGLDDDDERGPAATVDDDVESLLREARQLGATARADLAGADLPTKGNDVADLLSRAGDLVARAARDRGDSFEPSTDVPDYDDDSANDEPTDFESSDEDDDG